MYEKRLLQSIAAICASIAALDAAAVIFTGYRDAYDLRCQPDRDRLTWSEDWQHGPNGAVSNASIAWFETKPLAMGDGNRLGSGYGGPVVIKLAEPCLAGTSVTLSYRTKDFDGEWSNWIDAKPAVKCISTSNCSASPGPSEWAPNEVAYDVQGSFGGPSPEWFRQQYRNAGYEDTGTGIRVDGRETTAIPYSGLRFAQAKAPPSVRPESAGYMQVRVTAHGNLGAVEGMRFEMSGMISGIKP